AAPLRETRRPRPPGQWDRSPPRSCRPPAAPGARPGRRSPPSRRVRGARNGLSSFLSGTALSVTVLSIIMLGRAADRAEQEALELSQAPFHPMLGVLHPERLRTTAHEGLADLVCSGMAHPGRGADLSRGSHPSDDL